MEGRGGGGVWGGLFLSVACDRRSDDDWEREEEEKERVVEERQYAAGVGAATPCMSSRLSLVWVGHARPRTGGGGGGGTPLQDASTASAFLIGAALRCGRAARTGPPVSPFIVECATEATRGGADAVEHQ